MKKTSKTQIFSSADEYAIARDVIRKVIRRIHEIQNLCFVCETIDQKRRIYSLLKRSIEALRSYTYEELIEDEILTLFENRLLFTNGSCITVGKYGCDMTDAYGVRGRCYDNVFISENMAAFNTYMSECEKYEKVSVEEKISFEDLMGVQTRRQ